MTDQESVPKRGTRGPGPFRRRPRKRVTGERAKRRTVAVVGILLLLAVAGTAALTPGTSSGFSAVIGNGSNQAKTSTNFSPSGGVLPFDDSWAGSDSGWIDYGGTWTTAGATSGATYTESLGGSGGNKAVSGQTSWIDYTLQGDVKITSGTQAGLLFRVQNPTVGTDALNGYYLGLYTTGTLSLGRENNGYAALASTSYMPSLNVWYHLTVQVVGCVITASVAQVGGLMTTTPTTLTYTDAGCPTSGAIGVRDFSSTAVFRNVTATAGGTTSTAVATYLAPFANTLTPTNGWTPYGGTWSASSANETYSNTTGGSGEKSVAGAATWANYSLTGDVQLVSSPTTSTSAGLLVRVSNASTGTNALNGYYAGLSSTTLSLVRMSSGTATTLATGTLPATLGVSTWYHLTVEAVGCTITATAQLKTGSALTVASFVDTGCTATTGLIGVRTVGTTATWRDLAVTPR